MPKRKNILDSLIIETVEYDQPHAYVNDPKNQAGRRIDATIHVCQHCDKFFKRASQLKSHENSCPNRPASEKSGSESDYQASPAKQPKLNRSLPFKSSRTKEKQPPIKSTSAEHPIRPETSKSSTHIDELKKNSPSPNTPPKSPLVVSKEPATPSGSEIKPVVSESQSVSESVEAVLEIKNKKAAKGPDEVPVDNSDEAVAETKKFKTIPIRAKLLTDLPEPPHLDRYPNHIHYMLFISIPKFTNREFFYELLTKVPKKDNKWENVWWGDGTRHVQRKYRSSKKEPVPFVDDEEMVQQTFSYYFREGHFEKMRVRVHFNGEIREAEADV